MKSIRPWGHPITKMKAKLSLTEPKGQLKLQQRLMLDSPEDSVLTVATECRVSSQNKTVSSESQFVFFFPQYRII